MYLKIFIIVISALMIFFLSRMSFFKKQSKSFKLMMIAILIAMVLVRVFKYNNAMGLNSDEAMGGYNAWCLAHYGVSSHLNSWPVYLIAWGSGMNILYPFITIPFVKTMGMSTLVYRFPLILLSILAIFFLTFVLMKTNVKSKLILLFIAIISLSPWTIIANRWAVESNLFPVMMMFACGCYLMFINSKVKSKSYYSWFIIFNLLLGLSAYAYSCDWIFLFFFVIILDGYLLFTKKINWLTLLLGLLANLIMVWPLLLYIYVNFLHHHSIQIGKMTITKMLGNRANDAWVIVKGNPIKQIIINIFRFIFYVLLKNEYYYPVKPGMPHLHAYYPLMIFIALWGLIITIRNHRKSPLTIYLLITLIASVPLILITWNNYVRDNLLIIPIFYFAAVGVLSIFKKHLPLFSILFTLCVIGFGINYFVINHNELAINPLQGIPGSQSSIYLPKAINKANQVTNNDVYVLQHSRDEATTTLFYNPINPYVYCQNKHAKLANGKINFGKYKFIEHVSHINNANAYVVKNDMGKRTLAKFTNYQKEKFGPYTVYYK